MMRIYLTGFMGSGKTTIGRLLAKLCDFAFVDLDQEIERKMSSTIAVIFERHGEFYFRDQEREVLHKITTDRVVVSTGGGCFIENTDWMKENGTVVFLDVPFESLTQRLGADATRPLWKNARELFLTRQEEYRKAHYTVDASGPPEEVADNIKALLLPEQKRNQEN